MSNVFLGCPLYDGLDMGAAHSLYVSASQTRRVGVLPLGNSLLPTSCNRLLCEALNRRISDNLEWFAMLHSDIEPEQFWLDKLIAEADKYGADFMSAVVPVKDRSGRTSTAIAKAGERYGCHCVLTQQQIRHAAFPETFGIEEAAAALERLPEPLQIPSPPREALLANTGCMVYRLCHWRPGVKFEQLDDIVESEGRWRERSCSEDWAFSRLVAEHDGKVMATRSISIAHWGKIGWRSHEVWGDPQVLGVSGRP